MRMLSVPELHMTSGTIRDVVGLGLLEKRSPVLVEPSRVSVASTQSDPCEHAGAGELEENVESDIHGCDKYL
jgi:hypothetical protein